jgi:hypothetical protein
LALGGPPQVGGNAIEPSGKSRFGLVTVAGLINAQENFLRQIFSQSLIPNHANKEIHQRRAVTAEQHFKRLRVTFPDQQHQLQVLINGHCSHILYNTRQVG